MLDGPSKRSRGFAFIYFESVEDAKKAKESMDGTEIEGFQIRVDYSITDKAHKYRTPALTHISLSKLNTTHS